jgi:hypothetical protein
MHRTAATLEADQIRSLTDPATVAERSTGKDKGRYACRALSPLTAATWRALAEQRERMSLAKNTEKKSG